MTNPTPVAWRTVYIHDGIPQVCVMVHPPHQHSDLAKRPHQTDALYTEAQLNQAKADALAECETMRKDMSEDMQTLYKDYFAVTKLMQQIRADIDAQEVLPEWLPIIDAAFAKLGADKTGDV